MDEQIATLKLTVEPAALRKIISSGRLAEFAHIAAIQAANQINAQLVQHIAEGAVNADGMKGAISVDVRYVFSDGEPGFGTHPPGPRPPIVKF
ncbi:MAG: hypothetical protein ABSE86_30230 [Bryobacteraceae bacterium]|jgi:hypothetical protein